MHVQSYDWKQDSSSGAVVLTSDTSRSMQLQPLLAELRQVAAAPDLQHLQQLPLAKRLAAVSSTVLPGLWAEPYGTHQMEVFEAVVDAAVHTLQLVGAAGGPMDSDHTASKASPPNVYHHGIQSSSSSKHRNGAVAALLPPRPVDVEQANNVASAAVTVASWLVLDIGNAVLALQHGSAPQQQLLRAQLQRADLLSAINVGSVAAAVQLDLASCQQPLDSPGSPPRRAAAGTAAAAAAAMVAGIQTAAPTVTTWTWALRLGHVESCQRLLASWVPLAGHLLSMVDLLAGLHQQQQQQQQQPARASQLWVLQAAPGLALAVARACAACWAQQHTTTTGGGTNSSSSSSRPDSLWARVASVNVPMLSQGVLQAIRYICAAARKCDRRTLAHLPAAHSLMDLLLFHSALLAANDHAPTVTLSSSGGGSSGGGGGSSSSQGRHSWTLVVPAAHKAVLAGMPGWQVHLPAYQGLAVDQREGLLLCGTHLLHFVTEAVCAKQLAKRTPAVQVQQQVWQQRVLQLRLLMQLMGGQHNSFAARLCLLDSIYIVARASTVATTGSQGRATPRLPPAAAAALLHPVLNLLGPAVLHMLHVNEQQPVPTAAAAATAIPMGLPANMQDGEELDQQSKLGPDAVLLASRLCWMVVWVASAVEPKHLAAAAFSTQLLACCAVLEMAVRLWGAGLLIRALPDTKADGAPLTAASFAAHVAAAFQVACNSGVLARQLHEAREAAVADPVAEPDSGSGSRGAGAGACSGSPAVVAPGPQMLEVQLFSMLVSAFKAVYTAHAAAHYATRCDTNHAGSNNANHTQVDAASVYTVMAAAETACREARWASRYGTRKDPAGRTATCCSTATAAAAAACKGGCSAACSSAGFTMYRHWLALQARCTQLALDSTANAAAVAEQANAASKREWPSSASWMRQQVAGPVDARQLGVFLTSRAAGLTINLIACDRVGGAA